VTTPDSTGLGAQLAALKLIFRPSSPIDDRELFRGRTEELSQVIGAVQELGQHAVIFGERGIGKTSLAYMAKDSFQAAAPESSLAVRIPCSADDSFGSVWSKLIPRVVSEADLLPEEMRTALNPAIDRAEDILDANETSPETVSRALHVLSTKLPFLVILDEFDRIGDSGSTQLFADLIKTLSDDLVRCTMVLVGVADDVDGLISGHRSVERSLRQIALPRMSQSEIAEIVTGGFSAFERRSGISIEIPDRVTAYLVQMAQGFPHYAHLLAGSMGEVALRRNMSEIDDTIMGVALSRALDEAQQSIRANYTIAVSSSANSQFAATLLACALARVDEMNFFAPADVSQPLSQLLGAPKHTPDFNYRLHKFSDDPSWILEARSEGSRTRYRFANPLMRPYIMIKGTKDDHLSVGNSGIIINGPSGDESGK
jgi:Cdc6-like AAA superfamily ATPase